MALRTVTGTIAYLDGTAWAGGSVTFTLLTSFSTATETYPLFEDVITLDSQGQFSTSLAVPASGTASYEVKLPDDVAHTFYLAAGPAVDLVTLITISGTAVAQDDLQTLMDAAAVFDITEVTGTYGMTGAEEYIRASNGPFTITLPSATGSGNAYAFKNVGGGIVTIDGAGGDTIDGALTKVIYLYEKIALIDAASGVWDVM